MQLVINVKLHRTDNKTAANIGFMKTMLQLTKCFLTFVMCLISYLTFAQCEGLKGNKAGMKNWRSMYFTYFSLDSTTTQVIKADSILIFYFSNSENETNYGMPCCYYLAEQYAQSELKINLKILYKILEKDDSLNFYKAQKAWQLYYKTESEFIRAAFVGYANFSKYGQGREVMIDNASRMYQMIKDRILIVKSYIEMAKTQ
jgi:hypothetical protein